MDRFNPGGKQGESRTFGAAPHVPRNPVRAAMRELEMEGMAKSARRAFDADQGKSIQELEQEALIADFAHRRSRSRRLASSVGGDVYGAIPRFYDPTDYWSITNVPYDIKKDEHRFRLYKWLDLFYRTHWLIPILIDIYTRFPLVGIEFKCKDKSLNDFYEDLFLDALDYEDFLVALGREYWLFGQGFPLGSFNETLGVWEREELLDPQLVRVDHLPIVGDTQYHLLPPDDLKELVKTREPKDLYWKLQTDYPDLLKYVRQDLPIPISDVLLKQVAFKVSPRDTHGTPILLRALRTLMHEEKLLSSQDAVAERLYSPLVLAKLGTPDLGDGEGPWIPTPGEIGSFRDDLDLALQADFRLLVHHFGVEITNVFGREQMPRLDQDFDRVDQRLMMTFGINPGLLSAGANSQPYASSALQAEFMNQMLRTFQKYLIRHVKTRMEAVAEAQEHYDYEKRGDTRVKIMEEVVEYDEEGNPTIVEKPKLLTPDVRMKVLDVRDEATQRLFFQQLKAQGVPISDKTMAMGADFDFEEELDSVEEETVQKTVKQQGAKVKAYKLLVAQGLPIPADLKAEIEGVPDVGAAPGAPGAGGPGPAMGPAAGGGDAIIMPPPPGPATTPAIGPRTPGRGQRPEQSGERAGPGTPQNPVPSGVPQAPGAPGAPTGPLSGPRLTRAYRAYTAALTDRELGSALVKSAWLEASDPEHWEALNEEHTERTARAKTAAAETGAPEPEEKIYAKRVLSNQKEYIEAYQSGEIELADGFGKIGSDEPLDDEDEPQEDDDSATE